MKYFDYNSTPEEIKKQFRAYCLQLHPDKGGNAEDFKAMLNEYEQVSKAAGTWTKKEAENVAAFRRGCSVVFFGAGMNETYYIITAVKGERVEMVRRFSQDFQNLEDVEYYDADEKSRRTLGKYDHLRPLSEKFGIGYYWDDINGTQYTDDQIKEAERIADNFDKWAKIKGEKEAEEARKAQEEADRIEAAIIAKWSHILEQLPPLHKCMSWADLQNLPREQRKPQQDADKKAERKANAARLSTFKRNIKAVFNHYFPGVKVSVQCSSKCWCEKSVITWEDGPTVEQVQAIKEFDYFRACSWCGPNPWEDYGHRESRQTLAKFRGMFGAWSDDRIEYNRTFSAKTAATVAAVIGSIIPDYVGKEYNDKITTTDEQAEKVIKFFGFDFCEQYPSEGTEEEIKQYFERKNKHEDERTAIRRIIAPTFQRWANECYYQSIEGLFIKYYIIPETEKTNRPQADTMSDQTTTEGETLAEGDGVQLIATEKGAKLTGNTYAHKLEIKAIGARWYRLGQCWTISPDKVAEAVTLVNSWANAGKDTNDQPTDTTNEPDTLSEEERPTAEDLDELARIKAEREAQAEAVARAAVLFAEWCQTLQEVATAQRAEAERIAKEAQAKANQAEADQLRADIATMSEQLAKMGEALRQMSDRLATLTNTTNDSTQAPQGAKGAQELHPEEVAALRNEFTRAARKADEATEENAHTEAVIIAGHALLTRFVSRICSKVAQLLDELRTIDQTHTKRGHILPAEMRRRDEIRTELIRLTIAEYGTELAAILWGSHQVETVANEGQRVAA